MAMMLANIAARVGVDMAQNRKPPAFQMYASDFMANRAYRVMSLAARGLLISLLCECWVNKSVPSNHGDLAKTLGYTAKEISESLPAVMAFFRVEGEDIVCPELEDYRSHRDGVRQAQSAGGKAGAGITNEKRRVACKSSGTPSSPLSSPEMSGAETRRDEQNKSLDADFVSDYETAEAAAYRKERDG